MNKRTCLGIVLFLAFLTACTTPAPVPPVPPPVETPNLDGDTISLIARAQRVVFVIPFSHWDTDWHDTFPNYVRLSDANILAAIHMAQQSPRFRYTFEQVLFVQHFWEIYPQYRDELKSLVRNRQLTFAWSGITQPETSLAAPAVQVHNLLLGEEWIASTFGPEYVPHTAWQSDAFGNSAALPAFLSALGIRSLFIGRWQARCDPDYFACTPLPHAFIWHSPALPASRLDTRILVTYLSYPTAWDALHRLATQDEQLTALRQVVEAQFKRTTSRYIFLPLGSDFADPLPGLPALVDRWNAADAHTTLVMADPGTAFRYLSAENLPEITVDFNPIWQAFYVSRPFAKVADKDTETYLTAADKFGAILGWPEPTAWQTATINAHYDNIGAVSFDSVWEKTQRPRFEQTVAASAGQLSSAVAALAASTGAPLVLFNPTSWPRSEVVELRGDVPDADLLPSPVQRLGPDDLALLSGEVPPVGFAAPAAGTTLSYPASAHQAGGQTTLSNGLVAITLDAARGGTFSGLQGQNGPELLTGPGDDLITMADTGDIYGAFFGQVRARESATSAQVTLLADGPLVARAQVIFLASGQPVTKTVSLRAGSPMIEVAVQVRALPESTTMVQTPTILTTTTRTDDLGFGAFTRSVDTRPIVPGDVTYRRAIFYPISYWTAVSAGGNGLALLTHGLQGVGGTNVLSLLLTRQVSDHGEQGNEGVTDASYHTLRYAYLPYVGSSPAIQPWLAAYDFNQPLITAWSSGDHWDVQLPFRDLSVRQQPATPLTPRQIPFSMLSAQGGLIADIVRDQDGTEALVFDYTPDTSAEMIVAGQHTSMPGASLSLVPVQLWGQP